MSVAGMKKQFHKASQVQLHHNTGSEEAFEKPPLLLPALLVMLSSIHANGAIKTNKRRNKQTKTQSSMVFFYVLINILAGACAEPRIFRY